MNYFQPPVRPRQAVLTAAIFIFLFSTHSFAQDKAVKSNQTTSFAQTVLKKEAETNETLAADAALETDAPKKTSEAIDLASTQQQQQDDGKMEGIMGARPDRLKIGGHAGFVVPITARGNGVITTVADRFVFGFPVGLTVKTKSPVAIDFEFIPTFNTGRDFVLTIHPGVIYGFKKKYAVGVRAAYDAGAGSYGFTPLFSRGFKINDKVGCFIEADFPVRWNKIPYGDKFVSGAFAAHFGFAF